MPILSGPQGPFGGLVMFFGARHGSEVAMICIECGAILTDEEYHYYETRCETCEGNWLDAIEEWRHGGRNDEFDAIFSIPQTPLH